MSCLQFSAPELLSLFFGLLTILSEIRLGITHGPVVVREGSDALLKCSLSSRANIKQEFFNWTKGGENNEHPKKVFLYDEGIHYNNWRPGQDKQFKRRVVHFPGELEDGNASIIIRDVRPTDSGNYTCDFPFLTPPQTFHTELLVELILKDRSGENSAAAPKPCVRTLEATEYWDQLQCDVQGAFSKPHLQWLDSIGNQLPALDPQVSNRDGRYYVTLNTIVTKSDRYRCVVTQEELKHQTYAETSVHISAPAPEPYVRTLNATEDWFLLQCEVRGAFPKPHLQWQDSAGNPLPAEEPQVSYKHSRYYVTLNTTVTKSDRYRCVVTQEDNKHQSHAESSVHIGEKVCDDSSSRVAIGWLAGGFVLGALLVIAIQAVLKFLTKHINKDSGQQRNSSCNQEDGLCKSPAETPLKLQDA